MARALKTSKTGYKADSPDRKEKALIIPSGRITMKNVPHKVLGTDNLGNQILMYPNGEYEFPGSQVTEVPIMQSGGKTPITTNNPNDPRLRAYNDSLATNKLSDDLYHNTEVAGTKIVANRTFAQGHNGIMPIGSIISPNTRLKIPIFKKPVQPVVYQKPQPKLSNSVFDETGYNKKYPPHYVTDPKDPKIGKYDEAGPQWLYKKPLELQEPKLKPVVNPHFQSPDLSTGMATPDAPNVQQTKWDNTKPSPYVYTNATGKYLEGQNTYFPTEAALRAFAAEQNTSSIQASGKGATATGYVKELQYGGPMNFPRKMKNVAINNFSPFQQLYDPMNALTDMLGMPPSQQGADFNNIVANMQQGLYKDGGWIQGAVNPDHEGYCTPMTKSTCTPRRKAFAKTMKKHHGFHKAQYGEEIQPFDTGTQQFGENGQLTYIPVPEQGITPAPFMKSTVSVSGVNPEMFQGISPAQAITPQKPVTSKKGPESNKFGILDAFNAGLTKFAESLRNKQMEDYQRQMERLMNTPGTTRLTQQQQYGNPMAYQAGGIIPDDISYMSPVFDMPTLSSTSSTPVMGKSVKSAGSAIVPEPTQLSTDFTTYAQKASQYLRTKAPNTDITGEMLATGAQQAYAKYGKVVPVELALAQLTQEGYLAGNGNNRPRRTKNPFNVGNTDTVGASKGKTTYHGNVQSGINSYYELIASQYLKKKTPEQLLQNFTNSAGHRYAGDPNYEDSLKGYMSSMKLKKGGKYKKGGTYDVTPQEMMQLKKQGYDFETID